MDTRRARIAQLEAEITALTPAAEAYKEMVRDYISRYHARLEELEALKEERRKLRWKQDPLAQMIESVTEWFKGVFRVQA